MPTLFSWSLKAHGSAFFAHGVVSGHPKLPEGERIHTSAIRRVTQAEDRILLETVSGSKYSLLPEELDSFAGGPELSLPSPAELDLPPELWTHCIRAREQAAEQEEDALRALRLPGALRLRIVGATTLSALWSGPGGQIRRIPVHIHLGMFQDSVLVADLFEDAAGHHRVNLRYFPFPGRMEPYGICDGIETLLIVNEGVLDVSFGRREEEILCTAGKTTKIAIKDRQNPIPAPFLSNGGGDERGADRVLEPPGDAG